jgi:biotin carboxylase/CelD/BcsL family acetyltransferase involved in cellulose biosynthesis
VRRERRAGEERLALHRAEGAMTAPCEAETAVKAVAIVDPYDAGAMIAGLLRQHGVASVMVQSTPEIPPDQVAAFDRTAYAAILRWNEQGGCAPSPPSGGEGRGEGAPRQNVSQRLAERPPHPAPRSSRGQALLPLKGEKEARAWCLQLQSMVAALRAADVGAVLAGSERGVMLADRLGEALGVRSNGTRASAARRDKSAMIERAAAHGLRVPRQLRCDDLDQMLDWIRRACGWPVVLKPLDAMGSDGVRLCGSEDEAARAFRAIHGQTNVLGRVNAAVLAQEFVAGGEFVVDTVSHDGRHRLAGLWLYGKPRPAYATVGLFTVKELLPASGARAERLFAYACSVLDALEIRHGAAHCEIILDETGPVLVEVGARLHGGPPAHRMMRAAAGTSQLDLLVQATLFPDRFVADVDARYDLPGAAAMVMLRSTDLKGEIEALPSAHAVTWNSGAATVAGLATLIHDDRRVVAADLEIAAGGIACEILTSRDAVAAIAPDWKSLLARSRHNRAFGGPAWYLAALDTHPGLAPHVMVAARAGRIDGILPLAVDGDGVAGFATQLADYNDVVAVEGDAAAARRLLHAAASRLGPARLSLTCIRADGPLAQAIGQPATLAEKRFVCPFADVSAGYDAWLASRSRAFREHIRRVRRRADGQGVRVARLDPAATALDVAAAFLDLHQARFGERSLFVRDAAARAFVQCALPALFAAGDALLFGVWKEQELVGLNVCMRGADSLGYWNAGFRAEAANLSPGTLMLDAGLREACVLGLAEFDLLRGEEAYKAKWCTQRRQIGRLAWP